MLEGGNCAKWVASLPRKCQKSSSASPPPPPALTPVNGTTNFGERMDLKESSIMHHVEVSELRCKKKWLSDQQKTSFKRTSSRNRHPEGKVTCAKNDLVVNLECSFECHPWFVSAVLYKTRWWEASHATDELRYIKRYFSCAICESQLFVLVVQGLDKRYIVHVRGAQNWSIQIKQCSACLGNQCSTLEV